MPSRCLNKVMLIGNLTRDPELKYTPSGMAVISFGLATNRAWTTRDGDKREDAQFHRIVAWNKLAELCSQLLAKGRRIFVQGRIQYREFSDQEGVRKQISEVVIDDMILLDNKRVNNPVAPGAAPGVVVPGAVAPGVVGGEKREVTSSVDDGTIEDIVIPDELPGDKKETSKETSVVKDDIVVEPVTDETEKTKKDKTKEEEMPF